MSRCIGCKRIIRYIQALSHELVDGSDDRRELATIPAQTCNASMTVHARVEFSLFGLIGRVFAKCM